MPELEGASVYAGEYYLEELNVETGNDWFDLNLVIVVGEEEISFKSLLNHIKE